MQVSEKCVSFNSSNVKSSILITDLKTIQYGIVDNCGNIIRPDYVTKTFLKLLKRKNLKIIRFHDLRHTCASILLKNGANMKEIQVWLGHSNYHTTANLYAHLDSSSVNNTGKVMANVFGTKKEVVIA